MENPLVSIILTSYNQENYIGQAINSVFSQSYPNIQLIIIDNASTDDTVLVIEEILQNRTDIVFIRNLINAGPCKAFNQGLKLARGKYVIDLSGDDILLPERIQKQVSAFEKQSEDYAVLFSNARYIDQKGKLLNFHYKINQVGKAIDHVPSGDIYKKVLEKYFICTPTMIIRTSVMKELGGYDESLSFEDFDFWVRSSVKFKYFFQDEVLTLKRNSPGSLGTHVYKKGNNILTSYFRICCKAYEINREQEEFDLLANRIRTFIRKCFYAQEFELALKFRDLLRRIQNPGVLTELVVFLCIMRFPVNSVYRFYIKHYKNITVLGRIWRSKLLLN